MLSTPAASPYACSNSFEPSSKYIQICYLLESYIFHSICYQQHSSIFHSSRIHTNSFFLSSPQPLTLNSLYIFLSFTAYFFPNKYCYANKDRYFWESPSVSYISFRSNDQAASLLPPQQLDSRSLTFSASFYDALSQLKIFYIYTSQSYPRAGTYLSATLNASALHYSWGQDDKSRDYYFSRLVPVKQSFVDPIILLIPFGELSPLIRWKHPFTSVWRRHRIVFHYYSFFEFANRRLKSLRLEFSSLSLPFSYLSTLDNHIFGIIIRAFAFPDSFQMLLVSNFLSE